jgi:hypothetical protein
MDTCRLFRKSDERIKIEAMIRNAHQSALNIATEMVQDEYHGDIEKALANEFFVERVHRKVEKQWEIYRKSYKKLESLEAREDYVAMFAYAKQLDVIAECIPQKTRNICLYPFSGTDFYWARIFRKSYFEDISFDSEVKLPTMWWSREDYTAEQRQHIVLLLKELKIIPRDADLIFFSRDSDSRRDVNIFNNSNSTLLIKGGNDVLGYIKKRHKNKVLNYGAIIAQCSTCATQKDLEDRFSQDGYYQRLYLEGQDLVAPYAMELKDIYLFLKEDNT